MWSVSDERRCILWAMLPQMWTVLPTVFRPLLEMTPLSTLKLLTECQKQRIAVISELRAKHNTSRSCCTPMWWIFPRRSQEGLIGIYRRKAWKRLWALFDRLGRRWGDSVCVQTPSRVMLQAGKSLIHGTVRWVRGNNKKQNDWSVYALTSWGTGSLLFSHTKTSAGSRLESAAFGWSHVITSAVHEAIQYSSTSLEGRGSPLVCVLLDWTGWVMQPGIRWSSLAAANPPSHWSVWSNTSERLDQNHSWTRRVQMFMFHFHSIFKCKKKQQDSLYMINYHRVIKRINLIYVRWPCSESVFCLNMLLKPCFWKNQREILHNEHNSEWTLEFCASVTLCVCF